MYMKSAGYSSVPLAKKLGIKSLYRIKVINGPHYYFELFDDFPEDAKEVIRSKRKVDVVHYFTMNTAYLLKDIKKLKAAIKKEGMIWISWPKKSSGIVTDINENTIREIALKNGLVDTKVCAIDDIWAGLKLVFPVASRK
jgi:hypothetical protein